MSDPRIDVLMPVRGGAFLGPAIDTILAQRDVRVRLVVVDDGADEAARATLAAASNDPRVIILRNPAPQGLAVALNFGRAHCDTPLIARADGDDVYHPDRLARQMAAFAARPALGVLACGYRRIDAHGRVLGTVRPPVGNRLLRFRTLLQNPILHPGAMIRADVLDRVGGYDERFWTAQDADLWVRLLPHCEMDNLPEPLVDWRIHDGSILGSRGDAGRKLSLEVTVRRQTTYLGAPVDPEEARAAVMIWRALPDVPDEALWRGVAHLGRIRTVAEEREPEEVLADFRRTTVGALIRQARLRLHRRPDLSMRLLATAVAWRGRTARAAA